MAKWYYLAQGRPQGPVSLEQVTSEISAGRIGHEDRLYREGDTLWRHADEYQELKGLFRREKSKSDEAEWILLVRKPDGSGYKQSGPYRKQDIQNKLEHAEVFLTDYLWRPGLKEWYKILALPEFHGPVKFPIRERLHQNTTLTAVKSDTAKVAPPPVPSRESSTPAPAAATEPTSAAVQTEQTSSKIKAVGDLRHEGSVTKQVRVGKVRSLRPAVQFVQRVDFVRRYMSWSPLYRTVFAVGSFALAVGCIALFAYWSTFQDRKKTTMRSPHLPQVAERVTQPMENKEQELPASSINENEVMTTPPSSTDSMKPIEATNQRATEATSAAPSEEDLPRKSPTYLTIFKQNEGANETRLGFSTDGSIHFPIQVRLVASGGQVLGFNSYTKVIRLRKSAREREILLKDQGIPAGYYTVEAEMGDLKAKNSLAFGTKEDNFQKNIKAQRKKLILYQNEERRAYLRMADRFEKMAFKIAQSAEASTNKKQWAEFYRVWRKDLDKIKNKYLDEISLKNRNQYVQAELWLNIKEMRQNLLRESKRVNQLKLSGEDVSKSVEGLKNNALEFRELKGAMIQASLWRN